MFFNSPQKKQDIHVGEELHTSSSSPGLKGYAILNGIDLDMKTHDISPMGALVEFSSHYSIREGMKLRVHLDTCLIRTAIVSHTVTNNNRTLFALTFENPLPEAFAA